MGGTWSRRFARCACRAVGRVPRSRTESSSALLPDPSHPTGQAICVKGKAAPEIVYHPSRLLHPLQANGARRMPRTRGGNESPGTRPWTGRRAAHGGRGCRRAAGGGVQFELTLDVGDQRRRRLDPAADPCVRVPELRAATWSCAGGAGTSPRCTPSARRCPASTCPTSRTPAASCSGVTTPPSPDWPTRRAPSPRVARGAKLIVVDPRKAGLAAKADHWLRVRPGTDAALALSLTHVMIENGWYDADFVRDWTNAADVVDGETVWTCSRRHVRGVPAGAWPRRSQVCRLRTSSPRRGLFWEARPVAFYTWSGLEQHSGTTQTIRAIDVLYALTGSLDVPGGNVLFEAVPSNPIDGAEFSVRCSAPPAVGLEHRPLGPGPVRFVTGEDFYTRCPRGRITTLMSFGGNMVMAHADSARGREALRSLDFFVQADLFMTPTAELADIVLPGDDPVRVGGTEDRLRVQPGGAVARPAPPAARRAARRGPLGPADRVRPRDAAGPRRSTSGTATSRRPSAISSRRAGSPWRSCGPTRRECGCP